VRRSAAPREKAKDPLVRVELRRNLAAVHTYRNETFAALTEPRSVQHEVETLAPPELRFRFLQSLGIICDHADQWVESQQAYENSIQLGLQGGNVPGAAQSCLNFVVGLCERGHARRALLALERARGLIATMPTGHASYSSLDLNYGIVLRMLGDYGAALEHIQRAVQMGAVQTPGWLPLVRGNEALIWLLGVHSRYGLHTRVAGSST
jgi:tetratricopeptide (TPR) repeat protein